MTEKEMNTLPETSPQVDAFLAESSRVYEEVLAAEDAMDGAAVEAILARVGAGGWAWVLAGGWVGGGELGVGGRRVGAGGVGRKKAGVEKGSRSGVWKECG